MPGEPVGEVQEAILTCPRPTGGGGDVLAPVNEWVTAVGVDPTASWRMIVKHKLVASPYTVTTDIVDFGGVTTTHAQARMVGTGWASGAGRRLADSMFITSAFGTGYGCSGTVGWTCWVAYENTAINTPFVLMEFDDSYGAPAHNHVGFGNGLTAIVGGGATDPQKLIFYSDYGLAALKKQKVTIAGGQMDLCYSP